MLNKIKGNIFLILILAIGLVLAVRNYTPGTFLSGWDTLHPEFNFSLAFERQINGVFRPEQGLGAVAAHSHMADLPHTLILYIFHFILPSSALRYFYIFLNLILGPIGMYFFLKKYIVKDKIASFLGSLFYLLNLGTMQQFIVPFEMFTTQFALLPWLFLFANGYLFNQDSKKYLVLFSIITLLTTPTAYAATLWYVYFAVFLLYLSSLNLFYKTRPFFNKSAALVLLTLLINSFWILPNIYFALNHSKEVANALINQLFSPQAFLYNKEFGNFPDIALMKNFLFDWSVYAGNGSFSHLLSPWIAHLNQKSVQIIGFLFSFFSLTGIFYAVAKKNKLLISFLPAFFLCLFFLLNDNFPTSFLYNFLQNKIPLFKEVFRFPDDKVLGIFTFVFAVYFAQGQELIINKIFKKAKLAYPIILIILIIFYMLPAFRGNLISPFMRVAIPKEYFEMFDWFKVQDPTAKVANLPIHSIWGWKYYDWHPTDNSGKASFQGADFLQFGIKQPLLDRDFDRWNPANEQYYREMSEAIYSQNSKKLNSVLKKYDIGYIFVDRNVIAPEQNINPQILFLNEIRSLLNNNGNLRQVFNSGNLFVYKVGAQNQGIRIAKNPLSVGPASSVSYDDFIYSKYNDYITYSDRKKNTILYPFRNIIDNKNRLSPGLTFPFPAAPQVQYSIVPTVIPANDCPTSTPENSEKMEILKDQSVKFLRYSSTAGPTCSRYSFPDISRNQGYLISIVSRNISGLPLKLCVENYLSKRCDLFTQLSYFSTPQEETFLLPPMEGGIGLNLNFNNFAIEKSPAINDLYSVKIAPFPYAETSQIEQYNSVNNFKDIEVLVHSQAFEPGWKAYEVGSANWLTNVLPFLFGKELKEHVLVNNWANGWVLPESLIINHSSFIIIYWPQYLECLGFGILIGTFVWLFWRKIKQPLPL